jgi:hypothetical protein
MRGKRQKVRARREKRDDRQERETRWTTERDKRWVVYEYVKVKAKKYLGRETRDKKQRDER